MARLRGKESSRADGAEPVRPDQQRSPLGRRQRRGRPAASEILEQIHDGVISIDMEGTVQTWNPAAERIYGYTAEEAIGRHVRFFLFPEDQPTWAGRVVVPALERGTNELEMRQRHKDGREIYISLRLSVRYDRNGRPIGLLGCANDVTEQKRVAEVLRQQREQQEIILDAMQAMVWFKDRCNRILRANRAAAASIGKTVEKLTGGLTSELYPDEAADYHRDDLEVIASGVAKLGIIEQLQTASGEKRWVRTDKIPYRDEQGEIVGVIVFSIDITEQKRSQVALEEARDELEQRVHERTAELAAAVDCLRQEVAERRQAEERLEFALWATDLGLWDWNASTGRVVYDRRWAEMLGYSLDEIEPSIRSWERLVHPDDLAGARKILNEHMRQGGTPYYEAEHRMRTKSGEYRWILTRGRVVEWGPDGRAVRVAGTHRDITDRKRVEEQMHEHQSQLAHVLRLETVEGIAVELAHEINQPLGAIVNFANGLAQRLRQGVIDRDAMFEAVDQMSKQAMRAARVLERLRGFARKEEPTRAPCDVNQLILGAAEFVEPDTRRREISLHLSLDADLPNVDGDRVQLEQVFLNLLRNGAEAIIESAEPSGALTIETTRSATGDVEITVHDTGRGIPPALSDKMFDAFCTTKKSGLGMGLTISRSIIEAHDGKLQLCPSPEGGATFRITLPPSP